VKKYNLKQLLTSFFLAAGIAQGAAAAELEGVKMPDTTRLADGGPELVLNGMGLRTRFFFRVYVGALYLTKKTTAANVVINGDGAKRVALRMLRELSAEQFVSALEDGLKNNHSADELVKLDSWIKKLRAMFDEIKTAKAGDVIFIDYLPGTGTRITVNGTIKGVLPGETFNRALLRIWFGENPADSDLKQGMLGG